MKGSMKKLTILGWVVIRFAAGLFAGAIMLGGSEGPAAQNVAHAVPPPDPTVRAIARCFKPSDGTFTTEAASFVPIPKGVITISSTAACPASSKVTGGGFEVFPSDAKVRVTRSFPDTIQNRWTVHAIR